MKNRRIHTRNNSGNRIRVGSICLYVAVLCGLCAMAAGCKSQAGFYVNQQEKAGAEEESEGKDTKGKETASDSAFGAVSPGDRAVEKEPGESREGRSGGLKPDARAEIPGDSKASDGDQESSPPETEAVYVQVSGAVRNPGVYQVTAGSRIFEAVALAGGVTEEADLRLLNQALPVKDGQMIYVYARGETPVESLPESGPEENQNAGSGADGKVNLNTASVEQLMTLPGIGQAKAEYIVSYREEHGAFEKIEDIMKIEGIKEGVFSKIEDRIKVD